MSKLQVETISHTNNTTGMTISSGGVVDTPKQENRYELIKAYSSASNSSLGTVSGSSNSAHINFAGVFAEHYITYKLVVGWFGSVHGSNHEVSLRFLTGTNTEVTANSYRYHIHRMNDGSDSYVGNNSTGTDRAQIFRQISAGSSQTNVGMHGEINFYNLTNVTVEGQSSSVRFDSTADLAPIISSDMMGFDTLSSNYSRELAFCRYNTSNVNGYYTGFTLMGETGELAGTHMALYGLRVS